MNTNPLSDFFLNPDWYHKVLLCLRLCLKLISKKTDSEQQYITIFWDFEYGKEKYVGRFSLSSMFCFEENFWISFSEKFDVSLRFKIE